MTHELCFLLEGQSHPLVDEFNVAFLLAQEGSHKPLQQLLKSAAVTMAQFSTVTDKRRQINGYQCQGKGPWPPALGTRVARSDAHREDLIELVVLCFPPSCAWAYGSMSSASTTPPGFRTGVECDDT